MMDFKYHVTTITAIFLALAVGILFGMNLSRQTAVQGLAGHAIQGLSAEFQQVRQEDRDVRDENTLLKEALNARESIEAELLPTVVAGRLTGKRVALILAGDHGDAAYLHGLDRAIEAAGGIVSSTTVMKDGLIPSDSAAQQELRSRFGVGAKEPTQAAMQLAGSLARTIALSEAPKGLQRAAKLSSGLVPEGDFGTPADAVVVISCAERNRTELMESGNSIEAGILAALKDTGVRVVACETSGPYSVTSYLHRSGATTVDSIDKAPGQIALVMALAGSKGSFGLKSGVSRAIPPMEELAR